MTKARRSKSPISRRGFARSIAFSARRSCFALSSRSPECRGLPFAFVRPTNTACRWRRNRSAAITSRCADRTRSSGSPPTRRLSYIDREAPFVLTRPVYLVMGPDEPFPADLSTTCREFADRTRAYWTEWVRRLSIAYDWQDVIIRAAITLKLSNFEETGGIIAAHTTSIPEAPHSGRTWDYRFCWLRDAYFVVKALNRIGATQTMEDFISFILGIASEEVIRPVYSIVPTDKMDEEIAENLKGYRGDGPVRVGNAAAGHVPARHVRQHHSGRDADVLRPPFAAAGRPRLISSFGARRLDGRNARPSSPMPASGNIAAARACTRTRQRCAGPAAIGSLRSASISA